MSAIEFREVSKNFGDKKALDNVTFTVEEGDVFGFLGPNGAGKTTSIRCIMDFIRPTSGEVTVLGYNSHADSVLLNTKLGYLSSDVRFYENLTAQEHLIFYRKMYKDTTKVQELIEMLSLDLHIQYKHLSTGNKQKLGIVMAFGHNPELLILDEPTRGLDPLLQNVVYDLIKEKKKDGATVFMSSHVLSEVSEMCNRVGIIKNGHMLAIESMSSIKKKKVINVHVTFAEPVEPQHFESEFVEVAAKNKHELTMQVKGAVDPVLKMISKFTVQDLEVTHARLEDLFMEYYQNGK